MKDSPWRLGPFRKSSKTEEVIFGQVREDYSYEGALANGNVLCIASGGDLAFECLVRGAKTVSAVDVNIAQLWLIELKLLALNLDDHDDVLDCFNCDARAFYQKLRPLLSSKAASYFDIRQRNLRSGLQNCGAADRSIRVLAKLFKTTLHSKGMVERFLNFNDLGLQRVFLDRRWNDWRWRFAFAAAFNPISFKLALGRMFSAAIPSDFASDFRAGCEEVFKTVPNASNPFVWQALQGRFPPASLPRWLEQQNWELLKSNLPNLRLYQSDVLEFLQSAPPKAFDAVFLTNILDVVPPGFHEELTLALRAACKPGCHVVSRSFFRTGQLGSLAKSGDFKDAVVETPIDRSFFCRKIEHLIAL